MSETLYLVTGAAGFLGSHICHQLLERGEKVRAFVLDGNIIDMQNYSGDIWTLPDKKSIECMIYAFEHARGSNVPPAYTLDVGVHQDSCGLKTSVIEVHDFYACGTYNLNDHYHYPIMLWEWWNWYRKTKVV